MTTGWEYNTTGKCEKMPSTRQVNAKLESLPCIEQDGMVWIWPGNETPATSLPSLNPPSHYTIHAEVSATFSVPFCSTAWFLCLNMNKVLINRGSDYHGATSGAWTVGGEFAGFGSCTFYQYHYFC